jgi:hypothetical protein
MYCPFAFQVGKVFKNFDLTHPWAFKLLKKTQNEEDMVVKTLLEFLNFCTIKLGKKRSILNKCKENLLIILDKSF